MIYRSVKAAAPVACLAAVFVASGPGAHAQNVAIVRSGSFEAGPFIGVTYGIDKARLLGGGNITYAVNKYILPYFEYSYFPGFARTTVVGNLTATLQVPFQDVHGGVHIRIPIKESPIVPYGVLGVGVLHYPAETATFTTLSGGPSTQPPLMEAATSDFAFNFGGGIRYYVGQRWGMRVEAKVYKPTGTYTQVFGKVEFGVFYQFR